MDWNITKSRHQCVCGRQFAEGEAFVAALFEESGEFVRRDYCPACWEPIRAKGSYFSFWRAVVPQKEEKRRLFADTNVLLDFFLRLEQETEDQKRQFFYLLGLILMRKKLLKFDDLERADGQEFLLLRYAREDRVVRVPNPRLTEEQIEASKASSPKSLTFRSDPATLVPIGSSIAQIRAIRGLLLPLTA